MRKLTTVTPCLKTLRPTPMKQWLAKLYFKRRDLFGNRWLSHAEIL
ncbi:MAG: hypothetical protein LW823_04895 [Rickettsiales bacterium]|nr:hypothetical protein [Rickettsiales bacterium]